jgi:TonB-dependent receptor
LVNAKQALQVFNAAIASQFGSLAAASDECSSLYINTHNCDTQRGSEAVTSVYLMADLQFGQLEVIPGFRYEHSDIDNTFWVIPEDASGNEEPGYFSKSHTTYDKPLPSIQLNYRPGDLTVYRASIWTSYVRPSMFQLGGGEQISVGDGTRSITLGNPKLKAIDAVNFDASGEWANHIGSSANVAVFYKALTHFTFSSVNGFTNAGSASTAADGVTTTISQPENGGAGHVYGLELTGRQLFQAMPAPFDGFGVAGNLTLERSSVNTKVVGLDKNERLLDQPDLSSNLQAFYQKGPYQVDLSYRYIGAYVAQYGTLGANSALDTWVRDNERVDLHLGYVTPVGVHVDFSIANLLDADSYVASIGKKNMIIPSYVNSGRTYVFQMSFAY